MTQPWGAENGIADLCPACCGWSTVPERFLYAIGYAGLAATIWAAIVRRC